MTASAGIPGVPTAALDAIPDENTRMVLRAIVDGWQVRNGNTGKGDNRFVTAGELSGTNGYRMIGGFGNIQPGGGQAGNRINPSDISRIISDLQASVMESALWKSLGERVTLIQIDAGVNATGLATEIQNRLNGDNAIVQSTTTQFATVNGNVSALQTSQTTTANNVASLTSSVSTLQASVAGNTAAIQQESIVRANTDGLLLGQYTVKIDLNGYVSGFGLASTATNSTPFSEFIVRADRFAIGAPTLATEVVPFIVTTTPQTVNGRTVPPGVYIENAFIKNGAITNANIGLAEIDTLVIQGNAVTQPVTASQTANVNFVDGYTFGAWNDIVSVALNYGPVAVNAKAIIGFTMKSTVGSGGFWVIKWRVRREDGYILGDGEQGVGNNEIGDQTVTATVFEPGTSGVRIYTLQAAIYGDVLTTSGIYRTIYGSTIYGLGAKR